MKKKDGKFSRFLWFLWFCIFASICFIHIHAQAGWGRGQLSGVVVDEAGKPIANTDVKLTWQKDPAVFRRIKTKKNGRFRFLDLGSGDWEISVSAKGYLRTCLHVNIRQRVRKSTLRIILKKPTKPIVLKLLKGSGNLLEQGHQLFDAARYTEAQAFYIEFLAQHPKFLQVHIFIGDCYKELGAYEQAEAEYQKALKAIANMVSTVKANLFTTMGDIYLRQENPGTAVVYFNRALECNPAPQLAFHLGEIFLNRNMAEESIYYFKRAAAFKTDWGEPYLQMGFIYLNLGDSPGAISSFRRFLELSPNSDQTTGIKVLIKKLSKTLD